MLPGMLCYVCYVMLQDEKLGQHLLFIINLTVLRKRVIKYPYLILKSTKIHISQNL